MKQQQQGRQRRTSAAALHFQGLVRPPPPQHPLKCPRCDSMDTKFCYYNNYCLSQPRHLCKRCRRYWTQGGTCRNIPVGGSRSKKNCSKATDVAKDPTINISSSTVPVETSLLTNVCPVPAVTTSRISATPSQPAGGSMLPSYSYANDGLLSSAIAKPQSLNYSQDTFSSQPVINSLLFDVVNSFRTSLGFSQGFDAVNPMVSSLNNYDQQLQPTQSFHQDMYGTNAMNTSKAENWSGGLGGSVVNPNNDVSYTNITGHGYPLNNFWQIFTEKQHHNT